jgi:hypothetical protein
VQKAGVNTWVLGYTGTHEGSAGLATGVTWSDGTGAHAHYGEMEAHPVSEQEPPLRSGIAAFYRHSRPPKLSTPTCYSVGSVQGHRDNMHAIAAFRRITLRLLALSNSELHFNQQPDYD